MKKLLILLGFIYFGASAQNKSFDYAVLNTTLIAPTVELEHGRSVGVSDGDSYSAYFQYTLELDRDEIIVGFGLDKTDIDKNYTGYVGKIAGDFKGVINLGYMTSDGGYQGTYAGFSFAYQPTDNSYIGLMLSNVHSVAIKDGLDEDFYYYEKMAPKLYGSLEVIPHLIVFGQLSSRVNDISVKYKNERFEAGVYYSGNGTQGLYGGITTGRFTFMASSDLDRINFGLKFM